jgi:hypothetical protein
MTRICENYSLAFGFIWQLWILIWSVLYQLFFCCFQVSEDFAACLMVVVFLDHTCFYCCCFITPTSSQLSSEFLSYDCVAGGWNPFFLVFKPCMWRPAVTIATGNWDYGYSSVFGLIQVGAWEVGVEEAAVQSCTWDRESDEKSKLLLKGEVTRRDLQQIIK